MAGSFTSGGGNTTVKFEWTRPSLAMQDIITAIAHRVCQIKGIGNEEYFAGLSNQEKLNIVDDEFRRYGMSLAHDYEEHVANTTARDTVNAAIIAAKATLVL